ncbi:type II toxin-antitoxin system Phd/YefM family antitoxin [Actinacidiphila yeochonensis]|uniref:type II toxin-antitoxin system Phd/YefM family antitoxin n=1 Tax=Actinacidiphila yeochonensis TaxID=89050 RepID=UPI00056D27E5|nr:type II toxin-antitoxin system Phd/YefM family antitoxin [Actinacidiphila yeochonensis]
MAHDVPVTQARAQLAELVNRVVYGGEQVVLTRHGKPLVALVSAADLERLRELDARAESLTTSVLSSVEAPVSARGERQRFGIAAEQRGAPAGDRRP